MFVTAAQKHKINKCGAKLRGAKRVNFQQKNVQTNNTAVSQGLFFITETRSKVSALFKGKMHYITSN